MNEYYVLVQQGTIYVKDGEFFKQQGGLTEEWGKDWKPIQADSLADAYGKAKQVFMTSQAPHGEPYTKRSANTMMQKGTYLRRTKKVADKHPHEMEFIMFSDITWAEEYKPVHYPFKGTLILLNSGEFRFYGNSLEYISMNVCRWVGEEHKAGRTTPDFPWVLHTT